MESEIKEQELLNTLNEMLNCCDPIKYKRFNVNFSPVGDGSSLLELEKRNPKVGVKLMQSGTKKVPTISTLSIIATITDVLVGRRLCFQISDEGRIVGVEWFKDKNEV